MEDAFLELLRVERTSIQQLFDSLALATADVTRLRRPGRDTVPFPAWADLVSGVRKLFLASACATVRTKSHYHGRKPRLAVDFMNGLRMGQTERGSYVLTVISELPTVGHQQRAVLIDTEAVPFERRVIQTLLRSVEAANDAADAYIATRRFSGFIQSVPKGVSADLCDGLVDALGEGTSSLELSVDWSESIGRPTMNAAVEVSAENVGIFEAAKERLSAPESYEGIAVQGYVSQLERPEGSEEGTVTIEAGGGPFRRVRVVLGSEEYELAIAAHRTDRFLFCFGAVEKSGRSWLMEEPTEVELLQP
jgi:hypothetical protein